MRTPNTNVARMSRARALQAGVTLLELMVAVVIGAVLIFGATQVYVDSRNTYTINETLARLQENARFAISVMEPDIRLANYWGLVVGADSITGNGASVSGDGQANVTCGALFYSKLSTNIEAYNDSYSLTCAPAIGSAMPNADSFVIRRVSSGQSVNSTNMPATGPLRICSTRGGGQITTDSTSGLCTGAGGANPTAEIHDLIVNAYYIDRDSVNQTGLPSLRQRALWYDLANTTPNFQDQEITRGIEDMQIQYGVDTTGGFGTNAGSATEYLDAGTALTNALTTSQIVSVRIWLLVRADSPEVGFTDQRTYSYGDRVATSTTGDLTNVSDRFKPYQPSAAGDPTNPNSVMHYRRLLISRTILLRNVLGS
jgi:type IV pilus assembly protein PilW